MRNLKEIKPRFPRGKLRNDLLPIPRKGEQYRVFRLFVCLSLSSERTTLRGRSMCENYVNISRMRRTML